MNHETVIERLEDVPADKRMVDTRIPVLLEIG